MAFNYKRPREFHSEKLGSSHHTFDIVSGSQEFRNVKSLDLSASQCMQFEGTSVTVPSKPVSLELEFFDKDEQQRREDYRNRVEKHYCRLIEEERLSPDSASFLSDAFAEAEVRAKFGTNRDKVDTEVQPEYHTGIDKTVWREIDHQRSKSLERLKSQQKDVITDKNTDSDNKGAVIKSLNMNESWDTCDSSMDFNSLNMNRSVNDFNESTLMIDCGTDGDKLDDGHSGRLLQQQGGQIMDNSSRKNENKENVCPRRVLHVGRDSTEEESENDATNVTSLSENRVFSHDDDDNDIHNTRLVVNDSGSETLNMESEEEQSDSDSSDLDVSDEQGAMGSIKRSIKGTKALGRSMETWLGSPRGRDGLEFYKEQMEAYKEKLAARERSKMTEELKQHSSVPSASPTPGDYDADEEVSTREASQDNTEDHWSDSQNDGEDDVDGVGKDEAQPFSRQNGAYGGPKTSYDFSGKKMMSTRSSISSEKNRVDPLTYQSYTAGLLHSSGKSEKFLKLQKHFAVLERITAIEEQTKLSGAPFVSSTIDPNISSELYAKYDVQSVEELQWLYQELSEAKRNEEFFYDLQKLAVYHWTPAKDFGLKRRGRSLSDIKRVYEQLDDDSQCKEQNSSYFQSALQAEKALSTKTTPSGSPRRKDAPAQLIGARAKAPTKTHPRPLYGTNIPEQLDEYEIKVEAKKQQNKREDTLVPEFLHVRSVSAPYSKHLEKTSQNFSIKRADSSKGSLFSTVPSLDKAEQKPKPTGEVTPVPRQVVPKHQPNYPKILSGPHDFANRVSNNSEAVARPMQSNIQIYNSLENPQYQATVSFDEGLPARRLSRGRSCDNFIIQKDADGNYIVTSANNMSRRSSQAEKPPFRYLGQGHGPVTYSRRSSASAGDSPLMGSSPRISKMSSMPGTPPRLSRIDAPSPDALAAIDKLESPKSSVTIRADSPPPPLPARRSGIDNRPIGSVKTALKTFEKPKLDKAEKENSPPELHLQPSTPVRSSSMPRSVTLSGLSKQAATENMFPLPGLHNRQRSSSEDCLAGYTRYDPPVVRTELKMEKDKDGAYKKSPMPPPSFKVRDLRYLAENNELCQSKFYPKKALLLKEVEHKEDKPQEVVTTKTQPTLYEPVRSKVFAHKERSQPVSVTPPYSDRRRHSTSSTDTFIVKESDDDGEFPPLNVTYTKEQFGDSDRAKSVPDLTVSAPTPPPRLAKSSTKLNNEEKRTSFRVSDKYFHDVPSTSTGFTYTQHGQSNPTFSPLTPPPRYHSKHRVSPSQERSLYSQFNSEINSEEIVRDVMGSSELYKHSEPKERPKTPSVVSQMTMDYLQEIDKEWKESKGKHVTPSVNKEPPVLPVVEALVTSDKTVSPNHWEPVFEQRPTYETKVNDVQYYKDSNQGSAKMNERGTYYERKNQEGEKKAKIPPSIPPRSTKPGAIVKEYTKHLSLPRKLKVKGNSKLKSNAYYHTIPRMRPEHPSNETGKDQIKPYESDTGLGKKSH